MGDQGNLRNGFNLQETINMYAYVGNNPIKYHDPKGLNSAFSVYMKANQAMCENMVDATISNLGSLVASFFNGWSNATENFVKDEGTTTVDIGITQDTFDKASNAMKNFGEINNADNAQDSLNALASGTLDIISDISGTTTISIDVDSATVDLGMISITNGVDNNSIEINMGIKDKKSGVGIGASIKLEGSMVGSLPTLQDGQLPYLELY